MISLLLITQVSSLIAFILIAIGLVLSVVSLFKFSGGGNFRTSILFLNLYLVAFLLSVGFMVFYHWLDLELMDTLWYIGLNVSLIFGILSALYSRTFWKGLNLKKVRK